MRIKRVQAKIASNVKIGAYSVIGPDVEVNENTIIHSHVSISGQTIIGKENALLTSHKTHLQPFFGIGKDKVASYWMALIRQVLVVNFIRKEIEQYGVVKLSKEGEKFLNKPSSFLMSEDHVYSQENTSDIITNEPSSGASADEKLIKFLIF